MTIYNVEVEVTYGATLEIEANNKAQAKQYAIDEAGDGYVAKDGNLQDINVVDITKEQEDD